MSRIILVVCVVLTLTCSAETSFGQCDAAPGFSGQSAGGCSCSSALNQCGQGASLIRSTGCQSCNAGGGCSSGSCSSGKCSSGGCSSGKCSAGCSSGGCSRTADFLPGCCGGACGGACSGGGGIGGGAIGGGGGILGGILPRISVTTGQGGVGHTPHPRRGGLCGLLTDITGISVVAERTQTGNCEGCIGNQSSRYLKVMGGFNFIGEDDELDGVGTTNDGFILGFARGWRLNQNTRFEFESSWRNNSGDFTGSNPLDGRINVFSPTVNLYRDFGTGPLRPYIGGGIGVAFQRAEFVTGEIDDFAFAYQGAAGVALSTGEASDLILEYRYYGNTDTELEFGGATIGDVSYEAHNIIFGFRRNF